MARIRTIKPEFPQSESMGRVSRDARLCFIMLWTQADDSGRIRGASRMLASLLFPYDDDAPRQIEAWLGELEREGCILRYQVDGNSYIAIPKWDSHQKIDKPSKSHIPEPPENPREPSANIREPSRESREASALDLGPRTMDQDLGPGPLEDAPAARSPTPGGSRLPDDWSLPDDWRDRAEGALSRNDLPPLNLDLEAEKFANHWHSQPGQKGRKTNWRATWINWVLNANAMSKGPRNGARSNAPAGFKNGFAQLAAEAACGTADPLGLRGTRGRVLDGDDLELARHADRR